MLAIPKTGSTPIFHRTAYVIGALVLLFFLMGACNFPLVASFMATPTVTPSSTPIPTATNTPISSPTPLPSVTPYGVLPAVMSTDPAGTAITIIPVTITPYFFATITPTANNWSSCPGIVISVTDTTKGDLLHVKRCEDGLEYDLGPLAKGVYAVASNDKFLVYCGNDGILYANRISERQMRVVKNIRRTGEFGVFGQNLPPMFKITFVNDNPYQVQIYESRFNQSLIVTLPPSVTK